MFFARPFLCASAWCPTLALYEFMLCSKCPRKHLFKLHHRRPQTVAQISHEILETSPEHGHTRPAGKQDGTKDRRQAGLGDEPRRRTQHPRPDGRQAGRQDQRQEKDKPGGADTASQTRWETRWETRPEASPAKRTKADTLRKH